MIYLLAIAALVCLVVIGLGMYVAVVGRVDWGEKPVRGWLARIFGATLVMTGVVLATVVFGGLFGGSGSSPTVVRFLVEHWRSALTLCVGTQLAILVWSSIRNRDPELAGWAAMLLFFFAIVAIPSEWLESAVYALTGDKRFRP